MKDCDERRMKQKITRFFLFLHPFFIKYKAILLGLFSAIVAISTVIANFTAIYGFFFTKGAEDPTPSIAVTSYSEASPLATEGEKTSLYGAKCVFLNAESLTIEWSDTKEGHQYIVRYAPRYVVKDLQEVIANEQSAKLINLIPGNEYAIHIAIEGMPNETIEFLAKTESLEVDTSVFSLLNSTLYNYDRNDEGKYGGIDKLIEYSKTLMNEIPDGLISLPDAPPSSLNDAYIIVALLSINDKDVPEINDVRLVLRLNNYGTYEMRDGTIRKTLYPSVNFQLNDMLDVIYSQHNTWPQVTGNYELYINNMYIGKKNLTFTIKNTILNELY